jgi:prophage regulatory protein
MPADIQLPVTRDDLTQFRVLLCDEVVEKIKNILAQQRDQKPALLRMAEVQRRSGYGRSSIYAKVDAGEFPAPYDLGGGRGIAWREDEIEDWINNRDRIVPGSRISPRTAQKKAPAEAEPAPD